MATENTTTLAYQFKRVYGNMITELYARHTMTYNQFLASDKPIFVSPGGAGYYFSTKQADPEGVGGRGESTFLPEPLVGDGVQGTILPKLIYSVIRMSGLAIEAGKSNVAAFVNAQGDATMGAFKSLTMDLNRQCWGDGYGALATLSTTSDTLSTSTTWDFTCDNDLGVRYLRKGMILDFFQSNTHDDSSCASRISSINPTTRVVTMEKNTDNYTDYHPFAYGRSSTPAAGTIASGAVAVRYGARAQSHATTNAFYEVMGLLGIYDDGTLITTFEGINASTGNDSEFRANIMTNSSVDRELSLDLMLAAIDMNTARSGEDVATIRMGLGQRRKYFALLANDVRYTAGKFVGGYENLEFAQNGKVNMVVDPVAQPNRMLFEAANVIKKYELTPIGWGGFDPNKMHWRQDYDEATMFLRTYTNLGIEHRNAVTLLGDLTEPATSPF